MGAIWQGNLEHHKIENYQNRRSVGAGGKRREEVVTKSYSFQKAPGRFHFFRALSGQQSALPIWD
jgi:hypothetical protein